jgi:L-tyrosine C(3)-methyltransferase
MKDDLDIDGLALIAGGHTAFQLLWAGHQLGVFSALSKTPGMTRAQIATAVGLAPPPTRILLTGLAALRLILKEADAYRNSAIVEQLMGPDSPHNMADILGWQALIVYPGEMDFVESLRANTNVGLSRFAGTEDNLYQRLAREPQLEKVFHAAMSTLSRSANSILAASVDLSETEHLVDAGGGDATNALTLARAHPHLHVTVFDAPTVCQRAEANIAKAGMSMRVKTHPGNFFVNAFPKDIDAILFAHMLTIWSAEKNQALLRRAHDALPPGGQVLVFNMMGNDDDSGPISTALGSPYFLCIATGEGMLYSWSEYEQFLRNAGFSQVKRIPLPRDHGVLIGTK